jgi:hypothetical protein
MAIAGVLPYRQPNMQGFQLLAGVLQDRQRQQQQEDFYKRMQALEADFSKAPEDYKQDILKVEDRMSRVAAVKDMEDPAFAAERMKALSAERRNIMSQMQQRESRGEIEDYMVRAEALKNKYGSEIDKFNPFEDRYRREISGRQAGRGGANQTGRRIDFIREVNKVYNENKYTNKALAKQALEMRRRLYRSTGPITQKDMNSISNIISKSEETNRPKSLRTGRIYPGEGGTFARYDGKDSEGNPIWTPVRKRKGKWVPIE